MSFTALQLLAFLAALWFATGVAGIVFIRRLRIITHGLFPLGAAVGFLIAAVALYALPSTPSTMLLALGLPQLPFHLRLDALSAFFLLLLGAVSVGVCVYAMAYMRRGQGTPAGLQCFYFHAFLGSMAFVLLADDAYSFMVAWETMALTSYFLVTSDHRSAANRRAGFLYLLIAHIGAIAILMAFGLLSGNGRGGDYSFDAMRAAELSPFWATAGFVLALFGFGAKAGVLPVHSWLPEAHPAAPSPVSALMSAVMLKTAIYGLIRVSFDLLHVRIWWWGVLVLALGLASALFGVVFSAVQSDMKRLLAYSSIENIGLILVGLGLAITFQAFEMSALAALALTAALYHTLNHGFFKSLLFLCTGSVLHATGERALGRLGGLIHRMPWVAWLALIGTLAVAGLPPLNGFVSEWLLLQAFLLTPGLPQPYLNMLVPVAAAVVALSVALAAYVMVKFYGIIFLGQAREAELARAHDAGRWEKLGLVWLAAGCVLLGILPVQIISLIDHVTRPLLGHDLSGIAKGGWLFLAPINPDRASYSPFLFLIVIVFIVALTWALMRRFAHRRTRRSPAWDCGFGGLTPRMQDTAEGFGQPVRQVFAPFFKITRELPLPTDSRPAYRMTAEDPLWYWFYLPIARLVNWLTGLVAVMQRGRISVYLMYSFGTLLVLLLFVRR